MLFINQGHLYVKIFEHYLSTHYVLLRIMTFLCQILIIIYQQYKQYSYYADHCQ